jgi:polyferredoxin/YHS domain-containing protein
MKGRLATAFPWLFLALVVGIVAWDHSTPRGVVVSGGAAVPAADDESAPATDRDPVCGMTVRKATAYRLVHGRLTHHFCSAYCRDEAGADPARWLRGDARPADGGHTMRGIPSWMFQSAVAAVMLVSFGLFEARGRRRRPREALAHRVDLAPAGSRRYRLLRRPWVRFLLQLAMVAIFALIIAAGLFGNQNPAFNIAPILTWTLWWAGLIFFVLYFGKLWCYVCPWDAAATWMERLRFWGRRRRGLGLRLPWPKALRNIWLAVAFFVLLTWIELSQGVTSIPRMTAVLALTMFSMTVVGAFLFDRKSFCRYGCLVGRVSGLYALFSSLELRTRTRDGCAGCASQECYRGGPAGDGCPTFEYPRSMERSTYCTLCTECLRTCPRENVTLRLRPWASDLARPGTVRADEAVLAIILLSMTGFHGLTMIPSWPRWLESFGAALRLTPAAAFTVFTAGIIVAPVVLFGLLAGVSAALARAHGARTMFLHYAYALLPIALFYHLAHTAQHFLMEGPKILAIASDPFGAGWDLFGTARTVFAPLVTLEGLWVLQVLFVLVGHLYGLWISAQTTRHLVPDPRRAFAVQLPMLAAMILSSFSSLWLLSQPMEMRLSAM